MLHVDLETAVLLVWIGAISSSISRRYPLGSCKSFLADPVAGSVSWVSREALGLALWVDLLRAQERA